MPGSSQKINYTIRPAKHVQRKMIGESIRRLSEFAELSSYRYVGFGAYYFADFSLFHKAIGFSELISIEADGPDISRYEFNKPFNCVEVKEGYARSVLPSLSWDRRTVCWLDYDDPLDESMLSDLEFLVSQAPSGSMIAVSVDARTDRYILSRDELFELMDRADLIRLARRNELFKLSISELKTLVPREDQVRALVSKLQGILGASVTLPYPIVPEQHFTEWGLARLSRDIITSRISTALRDRNGGLASAHRFKFKQIHNFNYSDSAKMLTVVGVLYEASEEAHFRKCNFRTVPGYSPSDNAFLIVAPKLTIREIKHLEAQLPNKLANITTNGVPHEDVKRYSQVYRYFPTFAETDI